MKILSIINNVLSIWSYEKVNIITLTVNSEHELEENNECDRSLRKEKYYSLRVDWSWPQLTWSSRSLSCLSNKVVCKCVCVTGLTGANLYVKYLLHSHLKYEIVKRSDYFLKRNGIFWHLSQTHQYIISYIIISSFWYNSGMLIQIWNQNGTR